MNRKTLFQIISTLILALSSGCVRVDGLKVYVDDGDPISNEQSAIEADQLLLKLESFEQSVISGYQACGLVNERMELSQSQVLSTLSPLQGKVFVEDVGTGEYVHWRFSFGPVLASQGISMLKVEKLVSDSFDYDETNETNNWVTVAGERVEKHSGKSFSVIRMAVTRSWENRQVITWVERDQSGHEYCQYLAVDFDDASHLLVSDSISVTYLPRKSKKAAEFLKTQSWKDLWQL